MALKRLMKAALSAALGIASLWMAAGPSHAAGTLPLAMAQQIDVNGQPLAFCQVNFYVAGTVNTRQNVYQDFGLTQPLANPLACDQTGRIPMFWLADGLIHVQLTDVGGVPIIDTTMQVLGPSSGGGGGGGTTVDPTTILATGDLKVKYGTGALTGFVRANGLSIGNAGSGASERANADTQTLFVYLCGADPNLAMSGGRSGNCLNDYNAGKQLSLPDWRGRAIAALADMGNSATASFTATYAGCTVTTLGASCGGQSSTITQTNLPNINLTSNAQSVTIFAQDAFNVRGTGSGSLMSGLVTTPGGGVEFQNYPVGGQTVPLGGSNTPFPNVTPEMLATIYIKL